MAVPVVVSGAAVVRRRRRIAPQLLAALFVLGAVALVFVIGIFGALFGLQPFPGGAGPSATARAEIPPAYLELYEAAGQRYGIDPWILAGIGAIETAHGQSTAPGVRSGVNAYGCCAGPMQFSLVGSPSSARMARPIREALRAPTTAITSTSGGTRDRAGIMHRAVFWKRQLSDSQVDVGAW